jgi:hypothetical protein
MIRAIRAQSDVVVDLSELVFADASLMVDFAMRAACAPADGRSCCVAPSPRSRD